MADASEAKAMLQHAQATLPHLFTKPTPLIVAECGDIAAALADATPYPLPQWQAFLSAWITSTPYLRAVAEGNSMRYGLHSASTMITRHDIKRAADELAKRDNNPKQR